MTPRSLLTGAAAATIVSAGLLAASPASAEPATITLTHHADHVVAYETAVIATGRVSPGVSKSDLVLKYRDPTTRHWRKVPGGAAHVRLRGRRFTIPTGDSTGAQGFAGLVSKQRLHLRLVAKGNRTRRTATTMWKVDSYTRRDVLTLPVLSGSMLNSIVLYGGGGAFQGSFAVSPTDSVTLSVPQGCGRFEAGVSLDKTQNAANSGPFSALVQHNGVTAWSYDTVTNGPTTFSVDVAGGDTLTVGVTFDHAHTEWRPWFVAPTDPTLQDPKSPFLLCANP